jgi:hypothetical protein
MSTASPQDSVGFRWVLLLYASLLVGNAQTGQVLVWVLRNAEAVLRPPHIWYGGNGRDEESGLVKEVMGHESLDTTMGYLHPETSQIKVVIDRLNQQKYVM